MIMTSSTSKKKKGIGFESVEPAVTPFIGSPETSFIRKPPLDTTSIRKKEIPKGLWTKCPGCAALIYDRDLDENHKICPKCDHHFPINARSRIESLVDRDSFEEMDASLQSMDLLQFKGPSKYGEKIQQSQSRSGLKDAVIVGLAKIDRHNIGLGVMDFSFLGGSMGSVVGEKLTRLIEISTRRQWPLIIFSSSGGARMYEGMFSLMQMAKTCGALAYHAKKKLPYISILTHPTTAGVMASFATVGDLILAEPGAMIGFAGPRVIKDTTQSELPSGFQTAEFLQERGLVDAIVPRNTMRSQLISYLDYLAK